MTPIQQASSLADGTTIFQLPAGLRWEARHDLAHFRRGYQFTDVCVAAPFKALTNWRHSHFFDDVETPCGTGTLITDQVTTRVPEAALASMFAYRQQQLKGDMRFACSMNSLGATTPKTVAITGSRGLVGTALGAQLTTLGHNVVQLVRGSASDGQRTWNPDDPHPELLDGIDAVIHLAGEPILGRFNEAHKKALYDSRVGPTRKLAELAARTESVTTFVSASAVGYYGPTRGDEVLSEDAERGEGTLADVCVDWEAATQPARDGGVRVANLRTGAVLSGRGGMLPVLKGLFSTGLGGAFGDGCIWFSWVSIDDLTDSYIRAVLDDRVSGPVNAVSPTPVRNKEMVSALAAELNRPAILPIPSFGPAILLGKEGAQELALADQRVVPTALTDLGHEFRYPTIKASFAHELGGETLEDHGGVKTGV